MISAINRCPLLAQSCRSALTLKTSALEGKAAVDVGSA